MLQQRHQRQQITKYNQLFLTASAEKEPFQDVNVITLKGEYAKKVEMAAMENVMARGGRLTRPAVVSEMKTIFAANVLTVQEAVYRTKEGISVVVNASNIDDTALTRICEMVQEALLKLNGRNGVIKFGEPVSFTMNELPWLNQH